MIPNAMPQEMPMDEVVIEGKPVATPAGCTCDSQPENPHLNYLLWVSLFFSLNLIYRRREAD